MPRLKYGSAALGLSLIAVSKSAIA